MKIVYEDNHTPTAGAYRNTLVIDSADDRLYMYDCDGTWVEIGAPHGAVIPGSSLTEQSQVNLNMTLAVSGTITLATIPAGNITKVYVNGVRQISGSDYTIAGAVITFLVALINDDITIDYWI